MSSAEIALINLYLQAGYVFLTLVLAGAAIWSIRRTSKQSREALAASEKQSEEAIAAVNKQIATSEQQSKDALAAVAKQIEASERQSKAAIDAVHEQIEQSKRQAQQERFAANHPLLVPEGLPTFQDNSNMLDWKVNEQTIAIRNIGSGVALNVASVLFGCESYVVNFNKRSDQGNDRHWTCWSGLPIASGETKTANHKFGNGIFYEKNMHIGKYLFNAPPEPFPNPNPDQDYILARMTITYIDIFRRKHASIFDYVQHTYGWQLVEFLEDIKEDLSDLEG